MKARLASAGGGLLLALGSLAAEEGFTFPTLGSQPVVIRRAVRADEDYALVVFNRSSKKVSGIDLVFAGTRCNPPYKPAWPGEVRNDLDISPGAQASIHIPARILDDVAERSATSCGHAVATEIAVAGVRFGDGSHWDLGERVRAGEAPVSDGSGGGASRHPVEPTPASGGR